MTPLTKLLLLLSTLTLLSCTEHPQQADPDFKPKNSRVSFSGDSRPLVLVDAAHHNFLTIEGRYRPFAQVLLSDGYRVEANERRFSLAELSRGDILVVANALDRDRVDWQPPFGAALDEDEVASVKQWVSGGGSLMLIADHTPFPKVVEDLALAFGFEFSNGHVGPFVFRASAGEGEGTLLEHVIAGFQQSLANEVMMPLPALLGEANTSAFKPITQVKTFGGSAFKAPKEAAVLLRLDGGAMSVEPEVPFQVTSATPRVAMQGWSQGAVLKVGKGRVAVFAEGMMFSSQLDTKAGAKFGFTSAGAEQNERFLLNVMHWLSGLN